MKAGRWIYLAVLVLFPWLVWWGAKHMGHPVPTWALPGVSHPVGLFIYWGVSWELMALAPILELRGPVFSWAEEVGRWFLYTLFVVTLSGLFLSWAWGALLLQRFVVAVLPFLRGLALPLFLMFFFVLFGLTWVGVVWAAEHGVFTAFRHFVRYRLLALSTSEEEILDLMEAAPLPEELKAVYRERLQEPVSQATFQALLEEVAALPPPQSTREKLARARLMQALRNRLDEEAARQVG